GAASPPRRAILPFLSVSQPGADILTAEGRSLTAMRILRYLFFIVVVRPFALFLLGVNARHRERLPAGGPAIIAANHNSHLDTLVLMTLFPQRLLTSLRPGPAAAYLTELRGPAVVALNRVGIIPLAREGRTGRADPLAASDAALAGGNILILFPEGSRGEPERLGAFKNGIAHLARRYPDVPVFPVFLHGLGKVL